MFGGVVICSLLILFTRVPDCTGDGGLSRCRCTVLTPEELADLAETHHEENEKHFECTCRGESFSAIPKKPLCEGFVSFLVIDHAGIQNLPRESLQPYKHYLRDLSLTDLKNLTNLEPGVFRNLHQLITIYIIGAPNLQTISARTFEGLGNSFRSLRIVQTGLLMIPDLSGLPRNNIMQMIDLESNEIRQIDSNALRIRVDRLILDYNNITSVKAGAFNGSEIDRLSLKGNRGLSDLSPHTFVGLLNLNSLDLSETSITTLPTAGLEQLTLLHLENTPSLKVIPSVYSFKMLREAWLTYSFHCCAFHYPARHDPHRHALHQAYLAGIRERCEKNATSEEIDDTIGKDLLETTSGTWQRKRRRRHLDPSFYDEKAFFPPFEYDNSEDHGSGFDESPWHNSLGLPNHHENSKEEDDEWGTGVFHSPTAFLSKVYVAECGNLSVRGAPKVKCYPAPDALNPCEDIMGLEWLRGFVWIVVITAVFGNLAVLIVLLHSLFDLTVSKFLMCHLAFADLCMGAYLLILGAMDLHSKGEYFNYAYDWQRGYGCQVAGFLTVFASQLSIYTLTILTVERWFAITRAIYLNKRLKLPATAHIMAWGWIYSITMAALPLFGVSNYATTSICLPMETRSPTDIAYLVSLLLGNGIAFFLICLCYGQMYSSLSGAAVGESTVAKKMALLVLTDLACWAPIAFFGLTAVAGYPLIDVTISKILLVFFYPINSCANPYLYAILTSQYRKDLAILLARYGICTQRAQQYKLAYSLPTMTHIPVSMAQTPKPPRHEGNRSIQPLPLVGTSDTDSENSYSI